MALNINYNTAELEDKLKIHFKNKTLLIEALTHSSYVNQNKNMRHYERLEFLGDSILQLCISEHLYKNYIDKTEGELTRLRALIVCENSLHEIAQELSLGKYLYMSKGEELTGGRERVSILADIVEAIIAAIYLDLGLEKANEFILHNFKYIIDKAVNNNIILDYKTKLQEILQQKGEVSIFYNLVKFEGPPHRRKFYTEVLVEEKVLGVGSGYSKKESEQNAAREALETVEV
jgi:ribonuclease III